MDIKKIILLLQDNNFFKNTTEYELKSVVNDYSQIIDYGKNEVIFSKTNYKNAVGFFISGTAKVYKGKMPMSILKKGDIFGSVTLFSSNNYYATEISAQTDCKVIFINKSGIEYLLKNNVDFAKSYIGYLSDRIYFLNSKIDTLTAGNVEDNLYEFIKKNANYNMEKPTLKVKSYSELALALDSGRASLYRAMDSLTNAGKISREGKNIFLERID